MQHDKIAIIADDYTGAGDAGIHFARYGRKVELLLHPDAISRFASKDVDISLTSETRFLEAAAAAAAVRDIARQCLAAGFTRLFKKIDSTMRGNAGAEIEATLDATGLGAALICTAMPKTGRTCVDGVISIGAVPMHLTDIGRDPFHPLPHSTVAELLALQTALPVGRLGLAEIEGGDSALAAAIAALRRDGVRLIVADAVREDHLAALARQLVAGDLLPVGAGGFAEALAAVLAPDGAAAGAARKVVLHRPIVSVVGSLADISHRQAEYAGRSGLYRTIEISSDARPADIRDTCAAGLAAPAPHAPNVLLRVTRADGGGAITKESGERVARKLGLATASVCSLLPCRTIVSTGGSTTMAVARALGIDSVDLVDEILPGVVAAACTGPDGTVEWFISKAGGFGEESLLTEIDARCVGA